MASKNRISLAEGSEGGTKEPEKRTRFVNPPSLAAMGKTARILEKLSRREQIGVVNFLTTHFGLNEPPKDTATEPKAS